jgi:membrane-bound serine protease (ClpP class)
MLLLLITTVSNAVASSLPGLSTTANTPPITEASTPGNTKSPLSTNFTIGFPVNLSEKKHTTAGTLSRDSLSSIESGNSGKARIYEYGGNAELGENPGWHHTSAALRQAMNLGVDMMYIHLGAFADFNGAASDIRNKLTEFNKPMTVFLDNGTNSSGAIISLQPDSAPTSSHKNQVKTAVYTLHGNQFQEKYTSYVNTIMHQADRAKNTTEPAFHQSATRSEEYTSTLSLRTVKPSENSSINKNNVLIFNYKPTLYEIILDILLKPFTSYLLVVIMLIGLLLELKFPGNGFPLFASTGACILLFFPRYVDGFASQGEILLFVSGVFTTLFYFVFFRRKQLLLTGLVIVFAGIVLCMTPPYIVFTSFCVALLYPLALVTTAAGTVIILCFVFKGLRPVLPAIQISSLSSSQH